MDGARAAKWEQQSRLRESTVLSPKHQVSINVTNKTYMFVFAGRCFLIWYRHVGDINRPRTLRRYALRRHNRSIYASLIFFIVLQKQI